ncbi:hypothetical protein AB835_12675 [Candidatus Endobugula sertula]|uniref:Alpha/beta hydrolase n=1 Tax=Candidatus Endobugula sertula TaxID=62101 RepID=A0A1D2QMC0_9GAMM|nr:hypothetical protein AB835_12675 [Candidatus Endobugula sertula]
MKIKNLLFIMTVVVNLLVATTSCSQAPNQEDPTILSIQGERMYIMGGFHSESYDLVKTAIDNNPDIKMIVLTANDGSSDSRNTLKLARYIRSKKLNTHLINQSVITSGAVDLFLAGVHRTMEKGAKVGVHSWADDIKQAQAKDLPRNHDDHKLYTTYMQDMIDNDSFYWFTIYSAAAEEMYWMNDDEIKKYNLLTQPPLSASNDQTPFGKNFSSYRKEILEE